MGNTHALGHKLLATKKVVGQDGRSGGYEQECAKAPCGLALLAHTAKVAVAIIVEQHLVVVTELVEVEHRGWLLLVKGVSVVKYCGFHDNTLLFVGVAAVVQSKDSIARLQIKNISMCY
jgi:hypothetical protein